MISRKQYTKGEFTHREYYAQYVGDHERNLVLKKLGLKRLEKHFQADFQDDRIELSEWDALMPFIQPDFRSRDDFPTIAGLVCVLKEAALQVVEQEKQKGDQK